MLEEAVARAKAGQKDEARELLRQIVAEDPLNEHAWGWLAYCAETKLERHQALERVVELNPENEKARRALERLDKKTPPRLARSIPEHPARSSTAKSMLTSQCWYCGKSISLFRRLASGIHSECKSEYEENQKRFERALVEAATSDAIIDEVETKDLDAFVSDGRIKEEDKQSIGQTVYERLHKKALDDGYLSAGEREQLRSLQEYVGLSDADANAHELDQLRLLTKIIEGDLPHIVSTINLQKNEIAHFEAPTKWCHLKTRSKRVAGTRAKSYRISKGVRIRIPATPGHTEEYTELQTVDEGKVVITNKRIVFVGLKRNLNVKFDKILDAELYRDAVTVHRGTVNPTIFVLDDPRMFYAVLSGAMIAQNSG